jgi:ATP-dependent Clp protease protease subunit
MKRGYHFLTILILAGALPGCTILVQERQTDGAPALRPAITFSDPVLNQRRIILFGEVTETAAEEVIQKLFYLDAQEDKPIDLYLMTAGGDLKAAFSVENAMQLIRSRVNTHAFSECNSAGAVLLAAGTGERVAFRGAMIVIHGFEIHGKPHEDYVEGTQAYYTAFWRHRAKLPAQWLPIPPNTLHFLTAEEALEYGVVDKIISR